MKVISDGREGWTKQIECGVCKSQLEMIAEDIDASDFGSMGDYDKEYFVACPVCTWFIKFKNPYQEFPRWVLDIADEKYKARKNR